MALPVRGEGRGAEYALTGHKWFFSAPMCDAHLVVARMGAVDGPVSVHLKVDTGMARLGVRPSEVAAFAAG